MKYIPIPWSRLQADMETLADKIAAVGTQYHGIVAIARGGLTVSHILSDFLSLPVMSLTISSYEGTTQLHKPQVIYDVGGTLYGKNILMIDDVADTGDTFTLAKAYAMNRDASLVHTAAPYVKPHSKYIPDFYVQTLEGWVIYPYEVRESIQSLTRVWDAEGMSREDCVKKLRELSFTDSDINKYTSR